MIEAFILHFIRVAYCSESLVLGLPVPWSDLVHIVGTDLSSHTINSLGF